MKHFKFFTHISILFFLFFAACAQEEEKPKLKQLDESEVVRHTTGIVSSEGPVLIHFVNEMVDEGVVGKALKESPLRFEPSVKGVSTWIDTRSLEFRPEKKMESGRTYKAILNLMQNREGLGVNGFYTFRFEIVQQTFEIKLDGLRSSGTGDTSVEQLKGTILTADIADPDNIEGMIKASQTGKALSIEWEHKESGREHIFSVQDIKRKEEDSELLLEWEGDAIGVQGTGQRVVKIPSKEHFIVLHARAVQDRTRYIEILFSDSLNKDQQVTGLVNVSEIKGANREYVPNLRMDIENNAIKIFNPTNWKGDYEVKVSQHVRNARGANLDESFESTIFFEDPKPLVRFADKGVILPTSRGLTIPIEAINLRAVKVEALQIPEGNLLQFLQINNLDGAAQLKRVSPVIWKRVVRLTDDIDKKDQLMRYGLDISPLIEEHPGGMYRLQLSFNRQHILYDCPGFDSDTADEEDKANDNEEYDEEESNWDPYEENYNYNKWDYYNDRKNPCSPGYYEQYHDHDIRAVRNILISDIGLIAKRGSNNDLFVAVNDIKTTEPLVDANISVYDYQQQLIDEKKTGPDGTIILTCERAPYFIVADYDGQRGYLKVNDFEVLPVSHFDVSGATIKKGLKGYIYCERGVWRPGDDIYLTFILMDMDNRLPENHPMTLELRNPRGQLVKTWKKTLSEDRFHPFYLRTDRDALTGNWTVRVKVGGVTFEKILLIKTVMPNRLKINLDFGQGIESLAGRIIIGNLSSRWLHGAVARGLLADVKLRLVPKKTAFKGFEEYSFDDPARKYEPEKQDVFEGKIDDNGTAKIRAEIRARHNSPGMLTAQFTTRVFEPGGAFSIDQYSIPYHPYKQYVGIRVPKGDKARGMLLTDTDHKVSIVILRPDGTPVEEGEVEVELYKIKWRWWWEKGEDSIANYVGSSSFRAIQKGNVQIKDGMGEWNFHIKYPSWGRYLIRARDKNGNHISGKIVYIDWPGWAGRAMKDTPGGATVLSFSADKEKYQVGDKVVLSIPTGSGGRGLLSYETGSRVLKTEWFKGTGDTTRLEFIATKEMSPNVYAHVTYLQPHLQTKNDLPIRMYGVIPIKVLDPETRLEPHIDAPEVMAPESVSVIKVSEVNGKPMTYTVAMVDDGLLDLTRFKTPDPWGYFYKREALGVKTWDLYGEVAGAYGGILDSILAIGGDDALGAKGTKKANRFPPMVIFQGPYSIKEGEIAEHKVNIPQYVGSARIMVIAGYEGAYGSSQKSVFIRKPLMILGTLPRVLGPDEELDLPVSVFALEKNVKEVEVKVESNELLSIDGENIKTIAFANPGDKTVPFKLKVGERPGIAQVKINASGDGEKAEQDIELDVRIPGGPVTDVVSTRLLPDESWEQDITFPGIAGTNSALLEVSRIPPINLGHRLDYLIRYPHGCVEQVTSSVFPQLYLKNLLELSLKKEEEIQRNVKAGINKLIKFQSIDGGFFYWYGSANEDEWASNYAGHFLLEAQLAGYSIPTGLFNRWKRYQKERSRNWVTATTERSQLIQAYRLYTLALAKDPDLGGMNRLRLDQNLSIAARWRLAAAYQLAGQPEAALELISNATTDVKEYRELSNTYGSHIRDKAMILESLILLSEMKKADPIIQNISDELSSDRSLSTQTIAFALLAMAKAAGIDGKDKEMLFDFQWNDDIHESVSSMSPIFQKEISLEETSEAKLKIKNRSDRTIYPRMILRGIPAAGEEKEARNGLALNYRFLNIEGDAIDSEQLPQGTDLVAEITLENTGARTVYENIALTQVFPSGWEIINPDFDLKDNPNSSFEYQDVRDDRVYTYLNIRRREKKTFRVLLNATYLGKFYLPGARAEAMYDETINARVPGKWVSVVEPGKENI